MDVPEFEIVAPGPTDLEVANEPASVVIDTPSWEFVQEVPDPTTVLVPIAGADGQNGQDGQDGQDGTPGAGSFLGEYSFAVASNKWEINHGLGTYALVVYTFDHQGAEVEGQVVYVDEDHIEVHWYYPMTGFARVFN